MMDNRLWLATYCNPDGKTEYRIRFDEVHARKYDGDKGQTLVSVEEREDPVWCAVEPLKTDWFESQGHQVYSLRNHILAGGEVISDYRGNTYAVRTTMFGEDRPALAEDGKPRFHDDGDPIVHIGESTFRCKEIRGFTRTILLDPLDEAHVVDRFRGELVVFDAEIRVAPGTWPEPEDSPAP